MPNRFDIFITRLETKSSREAASSQTTDDQQRPRRDRRDAKPVRWAEPQTGKARAKHREKHGA